MTASRCSQSDSPQKGSPAKSPGRKRRALDPGPSRVRVPPTPASVELALSSRPKRAIRKSVLLASGDYEVSIPGVKIEETDTDINCDLIVTDESEIPLSAENTSMDDTDEEKNVDLTMSGIDVETMSNLEEEADEDTMITLIKEGSDNELLENDSPPMLEKSGELKRGRGRPRKNPRDEDLLRKETLTHRDRNGRVSHLPRSKYMAEKALSKSEAERINTYNVKLFQDEVNVTDYGDTYATVIPGCLSYLLRKERIIELLTNRVEIDAIRNQGWLSSKPPRLPPLVSTKSCFAFYIEGSQVNAIRDLSNDDLKPWTTTEPVEGEPVIKPNVRKHAIVRQGSRFIPSKGDPRLADIHLTEYSAWLPRLLRLRKKIFYLARGRTGQIIGNVLILYDYTVAGEAPTVLNVVHGNDLLKGLQHDMSMERDVGDTENPFVEGVITGTRGEKFLKVRPSKLGWINNKTLLLKYLINEPTILDDAGYLNTHVPYLPPLIEGKGVFVHFAPASLVADHLQHTGDGLSPWTHQGAAANHRVRTVKRALVQDTQGFFQMTKEDWQTTGLALVETITILSRCPRLRKRVVFVQRQNMVVLGIVCFMYEYIKEGRIPEIIKDNTKAHPAPNISRVAVVAECRRKKRDDSGNGGEEFINVEDLVDDDVDENVPEIISGSPVPPGDFDDLPEDSLDGGWDPDFDEDILARQENSDPFIDGVRELESGHMYLTVRHKRLASQLDTVLEYIANSNFVENHDVLNNSKPPHPPLVRNARAYVFFVAGNVIYPHDINRDDFSPWSGNGTSENPTCYRTKVRKIGVESDAQTGHFRLRDGHYKTCPFHLVHLYSIHPRENRLRKKISYVMDTASKTVVSHVMIMYDYNSEGSIPRVSGPYIKRFSRQRQRRSLSNLLLRDVTDDVSDLSESEKESPFSHGAQQNTDGAVFLPLSDIEFLNDRNRQLHYLINKPHLLESMDCLNARVPMFPPFISGRGAFIYFIDGREVDVRNLTCDGLAPWSENMHMSDGTIMCRRPKSHKVPLGLNRDGHLRVIRATRAHGSEYVMHIYAATLPRLPRLKKRIIYLLKDGVQMGHSMIAYWYTDDGELPSPVSHGNSVHSDAMYIRLPPSLRDEARRLLTSLSPSDAARVLTDKSSHPISARTLYNIRREMRREEGAYTPRLGRDSGRPGQHRVTYTPNEVKTEPGFDAVDWIDSKRIEDVEYIPEWLQSDIASTRRQGDINSVLSSLVDDASMDVSHTEEIAGSVGLSEDIKKHSTAFSLTSALGTSQAEAIFRYTHTLLETGNEDETFDAIWRLLLSRNESRLLHNIKTDFGVEIVADVMVNDVVEDEAIEVEVSEGGHLVATEVVDEETIPDNVHIDETQTIEMTRNANIGEAQVVEVAEDVQVMDETEMQEGEGQIIDDITEQ